jgi:D-arabinose 1-dehydrogenase-like Zn-dependent alcohol dehydrogenase
MAVQEFVIATTDQLTPIPAEIPLSMAAPVLCAGLTSEPDHVIIPRWNAL